MKFYYAPLEGITNYSFRNAHFEMFGEYIDKYYSPFISPTSSFNFKSREKKDILPENNKVKLVPQILTNKADEFIYTAKALNEEYGYSEVNLNLGCPSGTVVPKGRGSGFLAKLDELEIFLDEIFSKCDFDISVKTRIGKESSEEFDAILSLYKKYPIYELTIHPRTTRDMYKNKPNLEAFSKAYEDAKWDICYNGDINSVDDYQNITNQFPDVDRVMIGRGLIANPALVREIKGGEKISRDEIFEFADRLLEKYKAIMPPTPTLFKLKEVWSFLSRSLEDGDYVWKKIKKTKKLSDYELLIRDKMQ